MSDALEFLCLQSSFAKHDSESGKEDLSPDIVIDKFLDSDQFATALKSKHDLTLSIKHFLPPVWK